MFRMISKKHPTFPRLQSGVFLQWVSPHTKVWGIRKKNIPQTLVWGVSLILLLVILTGCGADKNSTGTISSPAATPTTTPTTDITIGGGEPPTVEVGTGIPSGSDPNYGTITVFPTVVNQSNEAITNLNSSSFEATIRNSASTESFACTITVTPHTGTTSDNMSICMALDKSGSMSSSDMSYMKTAAKSFVDLMKTTDQMGVITFATTWETLSALQTTTSTNITGIKAAIDTISLDLSNLLTSLYDSICTAVDMVSAGANDRKAVIALTDGGDTNSSIFTATSEVVAYAKLKNVPVYTIGMGLSTGSLHELKMQAIASLTGGLYFNAPTSDKLSEIYSNVSTAINSYYTVEINSPIPLTSGQMYIVELTVKGIGAITETYTFTITV